MSRKTHASEVRKRFAASQCTKIRRGDVPVEVEEITPDGVCSKSGEIPDADCQEE